MDMIEVSELAKTYQTKQGPVEAVRNVSFRVGSGEIVGFLGPNGAGKTTTMRMLTTLLRPSGGNATIAERDLRRDPAGVRLRIGYVSQTGGGRPMAAVRDDLVFQGRLYRLPQAQAEARADELIHDLELGDVAARMNVTLSGGQKRRVDVALGLVHQPKVLFLDEPSANLDPQSRLTLWRHIRRLRDEHGSTVFLSTHNLDEADNLCDRILIIRKGEIIAEDSPGQLKARAGTDKIAVDVTPDQTGAAQAALAAEPSITSVSVAGATMTLNCHHADRMLTTVLVTLAQAGVTVESVRVVRPTLDDVFLAMAASPVAASPDPISV
ncbi:MAG TPA: ATP-binding cassette domain-containing protein [Streptosporangiaceae bacterium]|nr:ATP-binding cassette domain-containing protein [Streptosporangiaceae bacterium]